MFGRDEAEITDLLAAWRKDEDDALVALMPLVYRRLKEIARKLLRGERRHRTLETTALVHEAYLRLVDLESIGWKDRAHFYAMSARIMRRVLVDQARRRASDKRGGDVPHVEIEIAELHLVDERAPGLIALDEALNDLARRDEQKAQIVELRFFGGLGREEIAEVLGLSSATVTRRWRAARAWLIGCLRKVED